MSPPLGAVHLGDSTGAVMASGLDPIISCVGRGEGTLRSVPSRLMRRELSGLDEVDRSCTFTVFLLDRSKTSTQVKLVLEHAKAKLTRFLSRVRYGK